MELATKTLLQYESPAWYVRQCQLVLSLSTLAFSNIVVQCPKGQLDKLESLYWFFFFFVYLTMAVVVLSTY